METILDSKTSTGATSSTNQTLKAKAASAPAFPKLSEEALLKTQLSAPSYLFSLRENNAPPFRKPENEPVPHLLIGTIMNEDEAVGMIAAAGADKQNGLKKFLG